VVNVVTTTRQFLNGLCSPSALQTFPIGTQVWVNVGANVDGRPAGVIVVGAIVGGTVCVGIPIDCARNLCTFLDCTAMALQMTNTSVEI